MSMTNVQTEVKDGKLTITVDLKEEHRPSKSGKTIIIASTHGAVKLEGGVSLNLNIYKPREI